MIAFTFRLSLGSITVAMKLPPVHPGEILLLEFLEPLQISPKYGYHEVMTTITLDEIQRDFLGCLKRVEAGETLVIVQADKPLAELKPVASNGTQPRPSGLCAGEFRTPDDFNDPLPEDVLKQFDGS